MRKWLPGADKVRQDIWVDLDNMVPTPIGTYHTMPTFGSTTITGGNSGTANYVTYYCWTTRTVSGTAVTYVAGETSSGAGSFYVETLSGTVLTNRSPGGTSFGTGVTGASFSFAQFGNTTVVSTNDSGSYSLYTRDASTTNNFAVGSASYGASIMCVQSNALLIYNLYDGAAKPDHWAASDIFSPMTFNSGEGVTPTQLVNTPGEITAAVPFGGAVIVFKRQGVYRHTYVGGVVKWQMELLRPDLGVKSKHAVIDTGESLIFLGEQGVWEFDGSSFRKLSDEFVTPAVNVLGTYIPCTASQYYPAEGTCAWFISTGALFYNRRTGAFGKGAFYDSTGTALTGYVPFIGKTSAIADAGFIPTASSMSFYDGMAIINVSAARTRQGDGTWKGAQYAYVTSGQIGDYQKDITVSRVIPVLRTNYYALGSQVAATGLELTGFFAATVTSSTLRRRFDGQNTYQLPGGGAFTIRNVTGSGGNGPWEIEDAIIEPRITGTT